MSVSIANRLESFTPPFDGLRAAARAVLAGEGCGNAKVTLALMGDADMAALHERFLGDATTTDVMTFPMSGPNAKRLEADLALGVEVAQRQAAERGHAVAAELSLYVVHGLLHLFGYDDHEDDDRRAMRGRERHYLKQLDLPDIVEG